MVPCSEEAVPAAASALGEQHRFALVLGFPLLRQAGQADHRRLHLCERPLLGHHLRNPPHQLRHRHPDRLLLLALDARQRPFEGGPGVEHASGVVAEGLARRGERRARDADHGPGGSPRLGEQPPVAGRRGLPVDLLERVAGAEHRLDLVQGGGGDREVHPRALPGELPDFQQGHGRGKALPRRVRDLQHGWVLRRGSAVDRRDGAQVHLH
mmetsp:Transcript_117745/g.366842  ORF Transcript_117745/g.366842 Transcript_117745/m.366842 type:complete len:211 (+) Transcript_117745:1453-2085(+)